MIEHLFTAETRQRLVALQQRFASVAANEPNVFLSNADNSLGVSPEA